MTSPFSFPARVVLEDECLRDGLQNETAMLSVEEKLAFIKGLEDCGVRRIQVGSFVHPKYVPQMANTDEVAARLERRPDVLYTALVLNQQGLERALACSLKHLSMSLSATETHNRKNTNRTMAEARVHLAEMIKRTKDHGIQVRAGIMNAFGCAYEGAVPVNIVRELAREFDQLGVDEINLADSSGLANPKSIHDVVSQVRSTLASPVVISLHLHDTRGLGLANMVAGLQAGVVNFDTSFGGLGGCPFIPNAAGNIATEDAVYTLEAMGIATGIDWKKLGARTLDLESKLGRRLPGVMAHLP